MTKQKRLQCPNCDRRFSLPAHLARHVNSAHRDRKEQASRPRKGPRARRRRAAASEVAVSGFDPAKLGLTQLCQVIELACAEAKRRLETR